MKAIVKHWPRIAVTLLPLTLALLHAVGLAPIGVLGQLDHAIYDARLRATSPGTLDKRIVIVDIDEKSLAEVGHWPWGRNRLAQLVDQLFDEHHIALLGFDVVFAEEDDSSGLKTLRTLADHELKATPEFAQALERLQPSLDFDAAFAKSLASRPVVLGYYLNQGKASGVLPAPVLEKGDLQGRSMAATMWSGYGSNIESLATAAPRAGYFNSLPDTDGLVRSLPMLAEVDGKYYESLSLAMFRYLAGTPAIAPGFTTDRFFSHTYQAVDRLLLQVGEKALAVPVDEKVAALVPYRGLGGPSGNSFQYVSASDVLNKRIPPETLRDKIVLLGTTAPGLLDLRATPVGEAYPGVEVHANVIAGLLDGKLLVKPDYALGYEVVVLLLSGLVLAFGLPLLAAPMAVGLSVVVLASLTGLNFWLYGNYGLVLPLASSLAMALTAFALNMSYGYFVESRAKRDLANLFGTYVPPELVDEMLKEPENYSMQASNRELTVMFCDMRGFTKMSENMSPIELQALLTGVFSKLTDLIRNNRGTIDKYMGDCVMAFWGAPVESADHAQLAVKSAVEMAHAVQAINTDHRARGLPEIGIGIGLNTGVMCVGDMGSHIRKSYTVIGDAVNLASRLEGLSKVYATDIVVSDATRKQARDMLWQELDKVRVQGKDQAVAIFKPLGQVATQAEQRNEELKLWSQFLKAYRTQQWDQADVALINLQRLDSANPLYHLYVQRVASMRLLPFDPHWDGATNFETK